MTYFNGYKSILSVIFFIGLVCVTAVSPSYGDEQPNPSALNNFYAAQLEYLRTQNTSLSQAIELLKARPLSDQEKFELIAQTSFSAVDKTLADLGFTVKTFHDFAARHASAIAQWEQAHPAQQNLVERLQLNQEQLMQDFDYWINQQADLSASQ